MRTRAGRQRVEAPGPPYRIGRRLDWQKTKCVQSDTFVIIGYQPASGGANSGLANIKVATFDGTRLRYASAVGLGFSAAAASMLRERLDRLTVPACILPGLKVKGAVWVAPDLQAAPIGA